MLNDQITISDGTNNHSYTRYYQAGLEARRSEDGTDAAKGSIMTVANTIDLSGKSKNRHLIKLAKNQINDATLELYPASVHAVISRDPKFTDAELILMCKQLGNYLLSADVAKILKGQS